MAVTVFTSVPSGVFGNLDSVTLVFEEGGADLVIGVSGVSITLTIGTTGGTPNLTWDEIATLFNADPVASAVMSLDGGGNNVDTSDEVGTLRGGTQGQGAGQFFAAAAEPPPPPALPVMTLTFKGQKVYS